MMRHRQKLRVRVVGLVATSAAVLTLGNVVVEPSGADPLAKSAFVGVGSDTTQDVFNAFSGAAPYTPPAGVAATFYSPLRSDTTSGSKTIVSWDAISPSSPTDFCITPKTGFPTIDRPNGSSDGQKALSRSIDNGNWTKGQGCSGTATGNVAGSIDFARSSSGPSSTFPGTALTFIPFARDGLSYAYYDHSTGGAAALTTAQLRQLYGTGNVPTGGTITLPNGHVVHACMVQSGSGTGKSWDKAMGNNGTGTTATTSSQNSGCNAAAVLPPTGYEENGYNGWVTSVYVSGLPLTDDAVIPFSASSWIAQANLAGADRSSAGRTGGDKIGAIDGISPIVGSAPNESPNLTFYANTTYGRDMYVVVPTSKVGTFGNAGLKSLFAGPTANICSANAQTIDAKFGLAYPPSVACGTTGNASLQSGLVS